MTAMKSRWRASVRSFVRRINYGWVERFRAWLAIGKKKLAYRRVITFNSDRLRSLTPALRKLHARPQLLPVVQRAFGLFKRYLFAWFARSLDVTRRTCVYVRVRDAQRERERQRGKGRGENGKWRATRKEPNVCIDFRYSRTPFREKSPTHARLTSH